MREAPRAKRGEGTLLGAVTSTTVAALSLGLPALAGRYTITYAAGVVERRRRRLRTAPLTTGLALNLDPYCFDRALWEWRDGGPYAAEVAGPNGQSGILLANCV